MFKDFEDDEIDDDLHMNDILVSMDASKDRTARFAQEKAAIKHCIDVSRQIQSPGQLHYL